MDEQQYAGFWIRLAASIIDSVLIMVIILPILTGIYGLDYWVSQAFYLGVWDLLINYVFPAIVVLIFWLYKSATPGKMLLKLSILNAETGDKPSTSQFIIRYLGYYVAMIPLFLGFIWVAFDQRKQGWHDKIAGTVVVINK